MDFWCLMSPIFLWRPILIIWMWAIQCFKDVKKRGKDGCPTGPKDDDNVVYCLGKRKIVEEIEVYSNNTSSNPSINKKLRSTNVNFVAQIASRIMVDSICDYETTIVRDEVRLMERSYIILMAAKR